MSAHLAHPQPGRRAVTVVLTLLTAVAASLVAATPAHAAETTARSLAYQLVVAAESGSSSYDRSYFKHWIDNNGDCQNTRQEVLIYESRVTPTYTSSSQCTVARGKWYSWYDGATWTYPSDVDIDHVVALKEAWESGARNWSSYDRQRFANDLGYAWSLDAVTDNVNASKGYRDPAEWLPPLTSVRCTYAIHWVAVKYRWRLSVDSTERGRLLSILDGSCGSRTLTVPPRAR
ncbi:MAG: HNH endonuclease family protein [Micromonosporaceae bacterium]